MNSMSRESSNSNNLISILTVVVWGAVLAAALFDAASPQLERYCRRYAPIVEACRRL